MHKSIERGKRRLYQDSSMEEKSIFGHTLPEKVEMSIESEIFFRSILENVDFLKYIQPKLRAALKTTMQSFENIYFLRDKGFSNNASHDFVELFSLFFQGLGKNFFVYFICSLMPRSHNHIYERIYRRGLYSRTNC